MRRLATVGLFFPLSVALTQSPVNVPVQQCVWRAGDNLAWAAPNLDETGWQPYAAWSPLNGNPRIWLRCHANLPQLAALPHPALRIENGRAFQAFLNGRPIGSSGDLSQGWYTNNIAPIFPLHEDMSGLNHAVIALRVVYRTTEETSPVRITAGEEQWLADQYDSTALRRSRDFMPVEVCYLAIGFAGLLLLGMYWNDRSRLELLLLAACCWCLLIIRTTEFIDVASIPIPWALIRAIFLVGQCLGWPLIWFLFRLPDKRVPWVFRLLILETLLYPLLLLSNLVLPLHLSMRASMAFASISSAQAAMEAVGSMAAPLVAFCLCRNLYPTTTRCQTHSCHRRSRGSAKCWR